MITTFMRRALTHMLARLGAPNPEVLAVFHPPGTVRLVTPLEQTAQRSPADSRTLGAVSTLTRLPGN